MNVADAKDKNKDEYDLSDISFSDEDNEEYRQELRDDVGNSLDQNPTLNNFHQMTADEKISTL